MRPRKRIREDDTVTMLQDSRAAGLARRDRRVRLQGRPGWRAWLPETWKHLLLLVLLALTFYPFVAMVFISGKDQAEFAASPWTLTFPFHLVQYADAWSRIDGYMLNSILYTGSSCLGVLVLSTISAYVFARYRFFGKEILFYMIIALLMVPGILTLLPLFILVKDLGLLNTRWALILPYISGGQVFGIFLLRSFFASLPEELFEAARIDGAGDVTMLRLIVLPLSWSIIGTLAIFQCLGTWSDLIWPVVAINDDSLKTIIIGLLSFSGQYSNDYGHTMAGYTIACVPLLVLFAFTSRFFVAGLTSGALKI